MMLCLTLIFHLFEIDRNAFNLTLINYRQNRGATSTTFHVGWYVRQLQKLKQKQDEIDKHNFQGQGYFLDGFMPGGWL